MKCSRCGFENSNGFKFCGQCGAKLEVIGSCPNCGTTLPPNAKFCPECGTRVCVEQIDTDNVSGIDTCPTELEFVVGSCRFKMIKVEGGTFTMDDPDGEDFDPWQEVTLTDFYIGQTVVTQALWKAVMGRNPSNFKGNSLPVENVSWNDCQAFIQKLNSLLSNELGGKHFALPTEAQWEFAARGGNKSKGYKYAGSNNIDDVAWYWDNGGDQTHPVARMKPNELGLFDMSGNVDEWCQDWYGDYSNKAQTNPQGPAEGSSRVIRGGGRTYLPNHSCRVYIRNSYDPSRADLYLGLRLCLHL